MCASTILPDNDVQGHDRDSLIEHYFRKRLTNNEILLMLDTYHDMKLSLRHLKRLLNGMGVRRLLPLHQEWPLEDIVSAMLSIMEGSGSLLGYRSMWRRLLHDHHLYVKRKTVYLFMNYRPSWMKKM